VITAMKAGDKAAVLALRTNDAAIQRASLDLNKPIDDALVLTVLKRSIKNLADAKAEFEKGGRADLVAANEAEIRILEKYIPKGIDPGRLEVLVADAIRESGAQTRKEMGKVIGALKKLPEAALIDFGAASKLIQSKLP
jgi:uncharacterized protein YqeY